MREASTASTPITIRLIPRKSLPGFDPDIQWKESPRRKIQVFSSRSSAYAPSRSMTKARPVTVLTATDISIVHIVSIRQQPMSQPHSMQCDTVVPPHPHPSSFFHRLSLFCSDDDDPRLSQRTTTHQTNNGNSKETHDTIGVMLLLLLRRCCQVSTTSRTSALLVIPLRNMLLEWFAARSTSSATDAASTTTSSLSVLH
jgi:hypothetical protein